MATERSTFQVNKDVVNPGAFDPCILYRRTLAAGLHGSDRVQQLFAAVGD
jgi:hypothetical protein